MRLSLVALVLLPVSLFAAGSNRYQYRPKDASANPTWKVPQFILADTEADLPSLNVAEGDLAYTKDSDKVWKRTSTTWVEVVSAGGGGGSTNAVETTVDFGAEGSTVARAVVTGQSWVTGTSKIVCAPTLLGTADRAEGAEDSIIEGLSVSFHSRVAGVGFTVLAAARQGRVYGRFAIHCTGS